MDTEYIKRVNAYLRAVTTAEKWLHEGGITSDDYERVKALILAKYGLSFRSIYR